MITNILCQRLLESPETVDRTKDFLELLLSPLLKLLEVLRVVDEVTGLMPAYGIPVLLKECLNSRFGSHIIPYHFINLDKVDSQLSLNQ